MKRISEIARGVGCSALALSLLLLVVSSAVASERAASQVLYSLAQEAYERGDYVRSVAYADDAAREARQTEGESALAYANALNIGAAANLAMANYETAKTAFERALPIIVKSATTTPEDKASAYHNLAEVHRELQQYDRALPLFEEALGIVESAHGPASPEVARASAALALMHHGMDDLELAEPLYRRAIAIVGVPGAEDRFLAGVLGNFADLLWRQDRLEEAESLATRSLSIEVHELGAAHPNVASTLNTLAGIQADSGRPEQALISYQRALQIRLDALGPSHPAVGTVHSNLAVTYQSLKRYDEAVTHFTEAARILDATPDRTSDASENRKALAETYRAMGRPEAAAALEE